MASAVTTRAGRPSELAAEVLGRTERRGAAARAAWPRTADPLPWALAALLTVIYVVPFDQIILPIPLPVDAKLDRFAIGGCVALVAGAWLLGARLPRRRLTAIHVAVLGYLVIGVLSILVNLQMLVLQDEVRMVARELANILGYAAAFWLAVRVARAGAETRNLLTLAIALGVITATGTLVEYLASWNVFLEIPRAVLPGSVTIRDPVEVVVGRPSITGPTMHGLSLTTMLAMTFALSLVRALGGTTRWRVLHAAASLVLLAGMLVTFRKTGLLMPAVITVVILAFRPRAIPWVVPGAVLALVLAALALPTATSSVIDQLRDPLGSASSSARLVDYGAVVPDIVAHPILGRGLGGFTAQKYRTLDNQVLGVLINTGVIGVAGWVVLLGSVVGTGAWVHRRARDTATRDLAAGVAAGAAGFGFSQLLYDAFAFPQTTYLFFLFAGLLAVACAELRDTAR